MTVILEDVDYVDTGEVRVDKIIENLELLRDAVNEQETDVTNLSRHVDRSLGFGAVTYAVDAVGTFTVLAGRQHPDMKLHHAYITAGGEGPDTTIRIFHDDTPLTDPVTIKSTEKRGKVVIADVYEHQFINRFEALKIQSDSYRRVTINMQFVNRKDGED